MPQPHFDMAAPPDPALGPLMIIVTSVIHGIALPLFAGRLYSRIVPNWRLSWDGYFLIAAVVRTYPPCRHRKMSIPACFSLTMCCKIFDLIQWAFLLISIS